MSPLGGIERIGFGRLSRRESLTQGSPAQIGQSQIEHEHVKARGAESLDSSHSIAHGQDAVTCPAERSQQTFANLPIAANEQEM
jgi:hypothetical protein